MSKRHSLHTIKNEREEIIPDPTDGYLSGSTLEHQKIAERMRNDLIERDLDKLVYVGKLGRGDCAVSFMCAKRGYDRRYHMRYAIGYGRRGGDWEPLAALFVDKVAIRKDTLEKQLGEENLPEEEKKKGVKIELGVINNRWESERGRRVYKEKRPFSTSQEWVSARLENQIGRNEWQEMEKKSS